MSNCYEVPETVKTAIEELSDLVETVMIESMNNAHTDELPATYVAVSSFDLGRIHGKIIMLRSLCGQ